MRTPAFTFNNTCQQAACLHQDAPPADQPEPYCASSDLIRAVNLAIALERPLLLEGEAGCGKTRLAYAVAYELGLPFYTWPVSSTSKAREGLYSYDAMLRLHDVQLKERLPASAMGDRVLEDARSYRRFGALGKAFATRECPAVVLIDEIDKADLDFPNDLLTVLDRPWQFDVPETGEPPVRAHHPPIVIITSNKEKGNLPAPFLRRCIYFYLEFPGEKELLAIVEEHYRARLQKANKNEAAQFRTLAEAAARRFGQLRDEGNLHKKPGASEFLDWLAALSDFDPAQTARAAADLNGSRPLPFPELLFKLRADWQRHVPRPLRNAQ